MPRLDTKLESGGAEFLALGQLLLQRIPTYKTDTNMPGYDLVATSPDTNRSARLQVKSRWRTGAPGFIVNNFDCEFVVVVRLVEDDDYSNAPNMCVKPHPLPQVVLTPSDNLGLTER